MVGLLQVGPGIHQELDQIGVALVRRPMESRIAVDVNEFVGGAHS